ncbi:hypothetical protein AXG93_4620s1820 [Marchantia polymorpha subsp. ruderalis]|uniref:Uncharacterized protein n=1 Tax=Marchantia polymorpha subsp. ruderalis TaxID=1480154 RepID=A0A176VX78_MARPO|nr:hypothetical protein AXG93_4620s1820 [Marchantia polymorpha subsp. ruderalis]
MASAGEKEIRLLRQECASDFRHKLNAGYSSRTFVQGTEEEEAKDWITSSNLIRTAVVDKERKHYSAEEEGEEEGLRRRGNPNWPRQESMDESKGDPALLGTGEMAGQSTLEVSCDEDHQKLVESHLIKSTHLQVANKWKKIEFSKRTSYSWGGLDCSNLSTGLSTRKFMQSMAICYTFVETLRIAGAHMSSQNICLTRSPQRFAFQLQALKVDIVYRDRKVRVNIKLEEDGRKEGNNRDHAEIGNSQPLCMLEGQKIRKYVPVKKQKGELGQAGRQAGKKNQGSCRKPNPEGS